MATQPDDDQEPLELTEDMELEPDQESDEQREDEDNPEVNDEDEQTVVGFEGEEPPAEPDNNVIRTMRQQLREKEKRIKELEQSSAPKPIEVGERPTLAGCDYDEDKFAQELEAFKDREAAAKRQSEQQAEQSRKANQEWQEDLNVFAQKRAALTFEDADDAIDSATAALDLVQQAVVVKSAADPALFLYALSKSEAKRDELAKIHDPIKLAAAVARMEGAVKVTKTRKAPDPDRPLRGSASMPGGKDAQLEKLEKEAARTGDRTKLIQYRKQLKDK